MSPGPQQLAIARIALRSLAERVGALGDIGLADKFTTYAHAIELATPDDLGLVRMARAELAKEVQRRAREPDAAPTRLACGALNLLDELLGRARDVLDDGAASRESDAPVGSKVSPPVNLTRWSAVSVYAHAEAVVPLADPARLALLSLWSRGQAPAEARFCDLRAKCTFTSPAEVDWTGFPDREALRATELWLRQSSADER